MVKTIEGILNEEIAKCQLYNIYQRTDKVKTYCIFYLLFDSFLEKDVECPFRRKSIDEFNPRVYFCEK